jgi:hypothetical protein
MNTTKDKRRIKRMIDKLQILWEDNDELRLGQLLVNTTENKDLFNIEDNSLEAYIDEALKDEDAE